MIETVLTITLDYRALAQGYREPGNNQISKKLFAKCDTILKYNRCQMRQTLMQGEIAPLGCGFHIQQYPVTTQRSRDPDTAVTGPFGNYLGVNSVSGPLIMNTLGQRRGRFITATVQTRGLIAQIGR